MNELLKHIGYDYIIYKSFYSSFNGFPYEYGERLNITLVPYNSIRTAWHAVIKEYHE